MNWLPQHHTANRTEPGRHGFRFVHIAQWSARLQFLAADADDYPKLVVEFDRWMFVVMWVSFAAASP